MRCLGHCTKNSRDSGFRGKPERFSNSDSVDTQRFVTLSLKKPKMFRKKIIIRNRRRNKLKLKSWISKFHIPENRIHYRLPAPSPEFGKLQHSWEFFVDFVDFSGKSYAVVFVRFFSVFSNRESVSPGLSVRVPAASGGL